MPTIASKVRAFRFGATHLASEVRDTYSGVTWCANQRGILHDPNCRAGAGKEAGNACEGTDLQSTPEWDIAVPRNGWTRLQTGCSDKAAGSPGTCSMPEPCNQWWGTCSYGYVLSRQHDDT